MGKYIKIELSGVLPESFLLPVVINSYCTVKIVKIRFDLAAYKQRFDYIRQ